MFGVIGGLPEGAMDGAFALLAGAALGLAALAGAGFMLIDLWLDWPKRRRNPLGFLGPLQAVAVALLLGGQLGLGGAVLDDLAVPLFVGSSLTWFAIHRRTWSARPDAD